MSYIGRSPQLGVRTRFYYTATGGETSLSGADDNGNTLVFSDGTYVDVLLNGITLVAGVDYNTSTANTISGLAALTASDVAEIVVYDVFSVGDAVSKSNGGTFGGNINISGDLAVTGDTTIDGTGVAKEGLPIITETTASRTFLLTDVGSYIRTTNSSATTVTIPPNSSVAFPVGAEVVVIQAGTGQVTFVAGSGVTLNSKDSNLKLSAQYSSATCKKVATDTWDVIGDLTA
jgi:hypothetical protein